VTIQGDYENGAAISPDPGTTIKLFGNIYGTSAKVYGYDDGDVFNIGNVVSSTPMTVTANGANNTFNVGSNAPNSNGIVDNIQGALTIVGDSNGTATLNVDDTGSMSAKKDGTLTSTALTGLNMGASGISYSNLANLNINLGFGGNTFLIKSTNANTSTALNSGTGADTVNVQTTAGPTTVNTGGGSNANVVNVGSTASTPGGIVDNIKGTLSVVGNTHDTMNVDDTGSTAAKTDGTLTPTKLTGLGMGTGGISYSGLATLNIHLGSGGSTLPSGPVGNTFTINDINAPTTTNVDGGVSNNDTVNYTAAQDFNGQLNLTAFEHGTVNVTQDFNGTLNDTLPGHLELVKIGRTLTSTGVLQAGSIDTMTVGQDLAGTVNVLGTLTTLKVTGDVSGSVTETGTVNLLSIGGSITSTGVIKAVNPNDPAAPKSTQGLLGNINTMTVGGYVAGSVQVSGNLGTLTVGKANTATTGGLNDVSGQIVVGGQLTTGSISGDVSGLVQEELTVTTLYVGGSITSTITSTGVIKAVNPNDPAMPTTPKGLLGNINTMTVGGYVAGLVQVSGNLGTLTVGKANTATTGGVNDVSGMIIVGGALTTGSISGNVSGLVQEDLTIDTLYIGGSLTSTGVIQAVNTTTPSLGNINTLTTGQNLAGKVIVSGTINNLAIVNGSMTPTGVVQVANLNTMTIGPARLSVGQDMAGQILVSGNLGSLGVAGGTPGSITAGHIGTVSVYGGFGPVVLQITENGIQRRVEEATPTNPYPLPNPYIQAATSPYATVNAAGTLSYINIQYFYESATPVVSNGQVTLTNPLANPQWTARITNGVSTAADQYDISLVTYNDKAKFNLARLDAAGVSGVRNVAVEGDVLTAYSSQAASFFLVPGPKGTTVADNTPAGVRLPLDKLAGVAVRDYLPAGFVQAKSIQALAFGSYTTSNKSIATGASANASTAAGLLASGTVIAQSNDTYRVPFADLATQQVGLFLGTPAGGGSFDNASVILTVEGVPTPNAAGTANTVMLSNVPRGAATAMVYVIQTFVSGKLANSVIQTVTLRGDGASIRTQQFIAGSITSTGTLGDLTLQNTLGITNITAPSIFGSIIGSGGITGTIQTTGMHTDPITSVVSTGSADLGNVYVATSNGVTGPTATVISVSGPLSGKIISRGRLISQVQVHGITPVVGAKGITGVVAAQGDIGVAVGSARLGGIVSNGDVNGQIVTLGNIVGDVVIHGGLRGGRIAAKQSILGNVNISGIIDSGAALVSGGSIGSAAAGTGLIVGPATSPGTISGIVAAEGPINLETGTLTSTAFYKANIGSGNPNDPNKAAIDAIFTDLGKSLAFDQHGLDLGGLALILADLKALKVGSNGILTGPVA
jgi:hypothetical protein